MAKVTMPQLGESVAEGTIGKWLKQPGDHVAKYEPLLEVITDKVNAEVPSPFEGILREILVEEGATVPNNAEIAVIETGGRRRDAHRRDRPGRDRRAAAAAPAASPPTARPAPTSARPPRRRLRPPAARAPAAAPRRAAAAATPRTGDPDARMTPAVRRLLREHGLERRADRRHRRRRPDHPRGRPRPSSRRSGPAAPRAGAARHGTSAPRRRAADPGRRRAGRDGPGRRRRSPSPTAPTRSSSR